MSSPEAPLAIRGCRLLDLQHVRDARGALVIAEGGRHVPFDIARVFYMYGMPEGSARGHHAHRAGELVLIAAAGAFDVVLDDGARRATRRLDRPDLGLHIGPLVWHELANFSPGALCLVLASLPYDEADYYRDYAGFRAALERRA